MPVPLQQGAPKPEFVVDAPMQDAVERSGIRATIEHGQVLRVLPILFVAQLKLDALEETRSRQGVRNRNTDVIRHAVANHLQRAANVSPVLARVTKLQEETDLDVLVAEGAGGCIDVSYRVALLHGIQDLLGARLGAEPDGPAAGACQSG